MAKNSFCYPEEETSSRHFHVTESSLQLQEEVPPNYAFEFQEPFEGFPASGDTSAAAAAAAAASSSHSHRQAEKRRRDRINAQLTRLRRLIPKSEKMEKALLLERVVEEVKELKGKASEISKLFTVPTEIDNVTVECQTDNTQEAGFPKIDDDQKQINHNNKLIMIKATFCCEDRTDLIPDLIKALKALNLAIIEAEIACLGGRMKSILLLYYELHDDDNNGVCNNVSGIKQSLTSVLNRVITWSNATTSNFRVTSKRQRFFFSS